MANRKLGKPSDQRVALLRNQTTALLWNGKVVTTVARAKEVRSIAEKIITIAVNEYDNSEKVEKESRNEKAQIVKREVVNDKPSKLAARRAIMAYLYDVPETMKKDESKSDFKERTEDRAHPIVEKLFRDIAPKYAKRAEAGKKGGYTRMYKLGPRRGDAAEMVVLELVD
ncbi:MAG TPA: bL17 family ribosomal protein [Candidatus Cryosericum sp.]|nr:bL17 family ribosomal protein [Candidatus Cryosericum sp.]